VPYGKTLPQKKGATQATIRGRSAGGTCIENILIPGIKGGRGGTPSVLDERNGTTKAALKGAQRPNWVWPEKARDRMLAGLTAPTEKTRDHRFGRRAGKRRKHRGLVFPGQRGTY